MDAQIATKDALSELSGDSDDVSEGSSNLYFTNARADARISNNLLDEDNFASDSATNTASQQSIKAYIATQIATKDNSDEITEGSTNLYFTNARARSAISASGSLSYNSSTGAMTYTQAAIDADSTTISNLEVDNLKATTLVTESEGIGSNDNDTTLPTSAAVKDYVDTTVAATNEVVEDTTPQLGGNLDVLDKVQMLLYQQTQQTKKCILKLMMQVAQTEWRQNLKTLLSKNNNQQAQAEQQQPYMIPL